MKKIIVIVSILLVSISYNFAQTSVSFTYDDAGNRETRIINGKLFFTTPSSVENEVKQQELVHKDLFTNLELKIFPNPTQGELRINIQGLEEDQMYHLKILSLSGKPLQSVENIKDFNYTLNITDFKSGTYLLEIQIDGISKFWKIIKE
jgi:hypothetical protein